MEPKVVVLTGKSTMLQWISAMTPVFLVDVSCWYHIQFWSYDMFCEKDLTRYFEIEENLLFFFVFFHLECGYTKNGIHYSYANTYKHIQS